ncbi:MAG: hypothetical protein IJR36_07560, partial [Lachnospiraceae bacterium]|nr:hypothetical protein [Lachnospiraceae bacterium]
MSNQDKVDTSSDVCIVCHRRRDEVDKMFHLTPTMCICGDCMQKNFDMVNQNNPYGAIDLSQMDPELIREVMGMFNGGSQPKKEETTKAKKAPAVKEGEEAYPTLDPKHL